MILALTSSSLPPSVLYDAADSVIAQRLSQIEGIAEVNVNGAEQPAIRVRVDPVALASMGLALEDVRTAIANTNAVGPVGAFGGKPPRRGLAEGLADAAERRQATRHRQAGMGQRVACQPSGHQQPQAARVIERAVDIEHHQVDRGPVQRLGVHAAHRGRSSVMKCGSARACSRGNWMKLSTASASTVTRLIAISRFSRNSFSGFCATEPLRSDSDR